MLPAENPDYSKYFIWVSRKGHALCLVVNVYDSFLWRNWLAVGFALLSLSLFDSLSHKGYFPFVDLLDIYGVLNEAIVHGCDTVLVELPEEFTE